MGINKVKVILRVPQNVEAVVEIEKDDRMAPFEDRDDVMVMSLGQTDDEVEGQSQRMGGDPPRCDCGSY